MPLEHDFYLVLFRGKSNAPKFAGRRFMLVDWYVANRKPLLMRSVVGWYSMPKVGWTLTKRMKLMLKPHQQKRIGINYKELVFCAVAVSNTK